jgi:hypothetical protein
LKREGGQGHREWLVMISSPSAYQWITFQEL